MNNSFVFLLECPFYLLTFQKTLLLGLVEFFWGGEGADFAIRRNST